LRSKDRFPQVLTSSCDVEITDTDCWYLNFSLVCRWKVRRGSKQNTRSNRACYRFSGENNSRSQNVQKLFGWVSAFVPAHPIDKHRSLAITSHVCELHLSVERQIRLTLGLSQPTELPPVPHKDVAYPNVMGPVMSVLIAKRRRLKG